MQLTVAKSELVSVFSRAVSFTARSALPILETVRFTKSGDQVALEATDLVRYYRGLLSCVSDTDEPFSFVVSARVLKTILSVNLPASEQMTLERVSDTNIVIHYGSGRYDVKTLSAEEFPEWKLSEHVVSTTVHTRPFLQAIRNAVPVAKTALESRTGLKGVRVLVSEGGGFSAVATDTHRLLVQRYQLQEPTCAVTVPLETAESLDKLASDTPLTMDIHKEHVRFSNEQGEVITQVIRDAFPNYERVIPDADTMPHVWTVEREPLIAAILALRVGFEDLPKIYLRPTDKTLVLKAQGSTTQAEVSVSYENERSKTDPFLIAINPTYLLHALRTANTETVQISLTEPQKPVRIDPVGESDMVWVVMPMAAN